MKSVLISIQPKWCELIASGKKTVEVRKTKPKLEVPFKCYIYCTKGNDGKCFWTEEVFEGKLGRYAIPYVGNGKVIGEFVCDKVYMYGYDQAFDESMGCYIDKFGYDITSHELGQTCLSYEEFEAYGNTHNLYGWHISDLKLYDKPRELSEFKKPCNHKNDCCTCDRYDYIGHRCYDKITRPFQSWGYVESEG